VTTVWPAAAQPRERHERSGPKAVQAKGVERIFGAGRKIAALPAEQSRKAVAVKLHEPDREKSKR
jgi:hypothetical protein